MPAFNPSEYGEVHQRLLQAFLSRSSVDGASKLKNIFSSCLKASGHEVENIQDVDILNLAVHTINTIRSNAHFKGAQLSIEKMVSEYDGKNYYVLVNRMNTNASRQISQFSETETELLKMILEAIVECPHGTISSVDCLNFVDDLKEKQRKMKREDAEKFLTVLVKRQWLEEVDGLLRLHPQGIMELEPYLRSSLHVPKCSLCSFLVIASAQQECSNCLGRTHRICMNKFMKRGNAAVCQGEIQNEEGNRTKCGAHWTHQFTDQQNGILSDNSAAPSNEVEDTD